MKVLSLLIILITTNLQAYVDLSLNYTLAKFRVDGVETDANPEPGNATTTSEGYQINWAWFIWEYTALELNYSSTTRELVDTRQAIDSSSGFIITQVNNVTVQEVSGAGIRQAFASRKAKIIPSLAIGYARYTTSGTSTYTIDDNGTEREIEIEEDKEVVSSSYVALSVRFRFTDLMGLTLGARAVAPDFDTEEAQNNLTYTAGFSWLF